MRMGLRSSVGSSWSYAPRMTASEAFWALEHAMKRSRRGSPRSLLKMRVTPTAPQSPPWMRKRGDSWELRVYAGTDPETGKRQWVSATTKGTRRAAQRALVEFAARTDYPRRMG